MSTGQMYWSGILVVIVLMLVVDELARWNRHRRALRNYWHNQPTRTDIENRKHNTID